MHQEQRRILFGGDYSPEQWPQEVWDDDVRLMRRAGVTTATVGVFSWARLEPRPGQYDFAWLDDVMGRLHAAGIGVMLATATASPPVWLARLNPESLPVTESGTRLEFGARQQFSPSSSAYREHALRLVEHLAKRYGSHPALTAWHVNNEYGCHVPTSYDGESSEAFRSWLRTRYGTIEDLNRAWGTAFWSQSYVEFSEVEPPRQAPTFRNPTQLLDWARFGSDALLELYRAEVEVLRTLTPGVPVTTNFMGFFQHADYWAWAPHLDFISDDAYPDPADPEAYVQLAASRDLMRSLRDGQPWVLMEQSTSAVNWRDVNLPKPAGLHRVHSLGAVARGADGILHFQWRAAGVGAEKFHAALLPHSGTETRVFREACELGEELKSLSADVVGTRVPSRVAMLFDWDSRWAIEQPATPARITYVPAFLSWYRPFLRRGVTVDIRPRGADLSGYDLVVAPFLHVLGGNDAEVLDDYVRGGGHLIVTYMSGVLDRDLHVWLDGYLGPLGETLGVRVREIAPAVGPLHVEGTFSGAAGTWNDDVEATTSRVLARYSGGFSSGGPAITRNERGAGAAWYVGTQPGDALLDELVAAWLREACVEPMLDRPMSGVEVVRRGGLVFAINHTSEPARLPVQGRQLSVAARDVLICKDGPGRVID